MSATAASDQPPEYGKKLGEAVTDHTPPEAAPVKEKLILVGDDDPFMRSAAIVCLEYLGYQVLEAGNGLQALQYLGVTQPALIVLDLSMPCMDGATFVRAL